MNSLISPDAKVVLQALRRNHLRGTMVETVDRNGWITERVTQAPVKAAEAFETVMMTNVAIRAIYVIHEAPKVLCAPKVEPKPKPKKSDFKTESILPGLGTFLGVLALIAQGLAGMFVAAIFVDPALIVELEDGSIIEVLRWYA